MAGRRSLEAIDERSLFAEYPFLPGVEAVLGGEPVSVRQLIEDPPYERARSIGRARVLAAVDDPRGARDLAELSEAQGDVRFLSFLFARLLLSAGTSPAALRRWAVSEAKRFHGRLAEAPVEELVEVARRLGFSLTPHDGVVDLPLTEYLTLAVPIREGDYRLAQQELHHGEVSLGRVRAARLLQEAVRARLAAPVPVHPDVVGRIREREAETLEEVARRTPLPVARTGVPGQALHPEWFPPCIRKMQRTLEAGENLSHAGRFALAAFLHRVGADFETIVDAYRGAPDFDESITRYQVEHITLRDGGAGYAVPECDTLRSHGLCFRDGDPGAAREVDRARDPRCFDPKLRHPLQYYRWRGGAEVPRGEAAERATSEGGPGTPGGRARSRSPGSR
jgi:DNA primase large subunit